MTPQEKLKEISNRMSLNMVSLQDQEWLIARVEQLEGALRHIEHNCACPTPEDCYYKACEALNTGPKPE